MPRDQIQAACEARLRRAAKRLGYNIRRSTRQPGSIDNFGEYMIVDADHNAVVAGARFDMSLAEVEAWLVE